MKKLLLPLSVVVCLVGGAIPASTPTLSHLGDTSTRAITATTTTTSWLGNISTRALVLPDPSEMIGGFIIQGTEPKTVIVRAIGPALTPFGIPNALADPTLELHDATQAMIAKNDNWQTTQIHVLHS
jgi:hypothetical protein